MPARTFRYEEDRTGSNPNNLVPNEEHVLPVSGVRFLVTKRGPYFTKNVRVVDKATGRLLIPRIDYDCIQLEVEQTTLSHQEVCSIIVIRNREVGPVVLVTYQAYGGWLSYSVTAILEMVANLQLDERDIQWGQIVGIPDRLPPAPHRHPLSDIYGWHKLFPGLGAIRDAIITGNQPLLDAFREGIRAEQDEQDARIQALQDLLNQHVNATGNVHGLHIHQINGYTQTEINDQLAQKLGKTETAVNAAKVYDQTRPELLAWMNANLRYNLLTLGVVPAANRAQNMLTGVADQIVTNTGYQKFQDLLARYTDNSRNVGIHWAGGVKAADARVAYANNTVYPPPILVGHNYYRSWVVGTGNGSYTAYDISRGIQLKWAPGAWIDFVSY